MNTIPFDGVFMSNFLLQQGFSSGGICNFEISKFEIRVEKM